jgi:tellurite resistance protein
MHDQDFAILKALVPVAWADGEFKEREQQTLDALLDAFGATDGEREAIRAYAATPKKLEDIDLASLSAGDRRQLLQHAVLLSFSDGDQSKDEADFLGRLVGYLHIPKEEAETLMAAAAERAKKHLNLL